MKNVTAILYDRRMRSLALAVVLLHAAAAHAHDFWIEPSTFTPSRGGMVLVRLRVGEQWQGEPVARSSRWIERFAVRQSGKERAIRGTEGADPAGWFTFEEGAAVIVYRSKPAPVTLPADRFEAYLREEGLERIIELRARRGESDRPGREIFSRCAKALVGGASSEPVDLRYEIVPLAAPAAAFRGRVLFEGKPLAGALIVASPRRDPSIRRTARSDANGHVSIDLGTTNGAWLIKSVHMVAAPADSGAEWESLWASLTFER